MKTRSEFASVLASLTLSHAERAIAFLWYYRQSQEFDERTASELAADLHEEGFPRPNVTRLREDLVKSPFTTRGRRSAAIQIDIRRLEELDNKYKDLLDLQKVDVSNAIIPLDFVRGTRAYIEKMVRQINGTYDNGFYDGCAVLCRRLMESLIIEIYVSQGRHKEIQDNHVFKHLDWLIGYVKNDDSIVLARSSSKTMDEVKLLGDTAAHHRTYITQQSDINDLRLRYRHLITELLQITGLTQ
jgi:hypothetical protein